MNTNFKFPVLLLVLSIAWLAGCVSIQSKPTSELKFRHAQLSERLGVPANATSVSFVGKFGIPFGHVSSGENKDQWEEKEEIERELWRRYKAGDKDAFLPIFKSATGTESK